MALDTKAIDYAMTNAQADALKGVALLPADIRKLALDRYIADHGADALAELFAQFIGLANSVVANNRECIELFAIVEGGEHPYTAEKYNLPTIFGALCGVSLANSLTEGEPCVGCAYRLGTPANQSPSTTLDAEWCENEGEPRFHCHEDLNELGEPSRLCVGHALRTRGQQRPEAA